MYECIGVPQIIEKSVPQTLPLMSTRNQSGDVKELDGNRSSSIYATTVIRFASIRDIISSASTIDLKVADGSLRIDCREAVAVSINLKSARWDLAENCLDAISALLPPGIVS